LQIKAPTPCIAGVVEFKVHMDSVAILWTPVKSFERAL